MSNDLALDYALISALLQSRNHDLLLRRSFQSDFLKKNPKAVYDFCIEYKKVHKALPSVTLVKEKFGIMLPSPEGTLEYYYDEIMKRRVHDNLVNCFALASEYIDSGDPLQALEFTKNYLRNELSFGTTIIRLQDHRTVARELNQSYLDAKAGKTGILFPWATMNDWTNGGMRPGDVSFCVARTGVGKTWNTIPISVCAASAGFRVLYISGEMTYESLFKRVFAYELKLPYAKMLRGKLSEIDEKRYFDRLEEKQAHYLDHLKCLEISASGDSQITFDRIQSQIDNFSPDLVIADSCYRFVPTKKSRDRNEAMAYVVEDLKNLAVSNNTHIFATTQLNRESVKNKKKGSAGAAMENVAMTDNINWIASSIFSLSHPDDENGNPNKKIIDIHPLKIREGGDFYKNKMSTNWNFETMDFSETQDTGLFSSYPSGFNPDKPVDDFRSETDEQGYALF